MREIILDTETTGLDPHSGHRIVEIGCVELLNLIPTGQTFHVYLNPDRDMPEEAFRVHGLSIDFLSDKPRFADVADGFLAFVDGARLVAHNASFDLNFLNAELRSLGRDLIPPELVVDSLALARRRHPGGRNSLDDLCSRFGIDSSRRTKHGALLDAELLAEVYAELMGGRQTVLGLGAVAPGIGRAGVAVAARPRPEPLAPRLDEAAAIRHAAFVATLGGDAIWRDYLPDAGAPGS